MNFPLSTAILLFPAMLLMLEVGRRLRGRHVDAESSRVIEGAVFGLFGLLLALTFSGAISRLEAHRMLLTQETNAIRTAYLRLGLLPTSAQPPLQHLFREYTTSRLHLFDDVRAETSSESLRLQDEIWQRSLAAAASDGASVDANKLLLPALNDMIDITSTRHNAFNMHPPGVVFLLLFFLSCGSAFMAGYSMTSDRREWVYAIALAASVTFTVFATLEIEYPRRGFIRFTQLDDSLITLRDSMK